MQIYMKSNSTVLGEALDRIKNTFILDKGAQSETETHYQNAPHVNRLFMKHFEKTPAPSRNQDVRSIDNRTCVTMKALYHSKIEYYKN